MILAPHKNFRDQCDISAIWKAPNVTVSLGGCGNQNFVRRITRHMGCQTELNGTVLVHDCFYILDPIGVLYYYITLIQCDFLKIGMAI